MESDRLGPNWEHSWSNVITLKLVGHNNETVIHYRIYFIKYRSFYRLCCQCGTLITPNPANMCVACLRTQIDISEGIPKQATLYFCKGCDRLNYIYFFCKHCMILKLCY